ncbi:hypothetical protein EWM64_g9421 [Hericium alpestre]|uniref:Uncharacterized protein n=1 Tax=Hericium alpestre TaxID=135208 RepID=A0A4Y9ZIT4_9AGAM|nr:hypothetical protein EWM64_g9421 [Hericium alpestre]
MVDMPAKTTLALQVEELQLLKYALLPGELLTFLLPPEEAALWTRALDADTPDPQSALDALGHLEPGRQASPLRFEIALAQTRSVYFEVEFPPSRPHPDLHPGAASPPAAPSVSVRGEQLGREEQLRWQGLVAAKTREVAESASE